MYLQQSQESHAMFRALWGRGGAVGVFDAHGPSMCVRACTVHMYVLHTVCITLGLSPSHSVHYTLLDADLYLHTSDTHVCKYVYTYICNRYIAQINSAWGSVPRQGGREGVGIKNVTPGL